MLKEIKESFVNFFTRFFFQPDQEVFDPDWVPLDSGGMSAEQINNYLIANLDRIRFYSRYLWYTNDAYKGIIRTYIKYIAGRPPQIESKNDLSMAKWNKFFSEKQFRRFMKEWVRRFFLDGETFLYLPTMTFIDPSMVVEPTIYGNASYGIEWDYAGKEIAFFVKKGTNIFRVDGGYILHTDDTDDDQKRGLPYLLTAQKKLEDYDNLLDFRVQLNKIRSSIALIRKHTASSDKIKSFADARKETTMTDSSGRSFRGKYIKPGEILDVGINTTYEFLNPKVDATDVKEDLRAIRLCASASTGLPEFMITGDASNSNYASTMVAEGPGEKEIEDWQNFFGEELIEIWKYVTGDQMPPEIRFLPIISRKTKEETDRNKTLFEAGVISLDEWRRRENVDSEKMELEINGAFTTKKDGKKEFKDLIGLQTPEKDFDKSGQF